MKLKLRAVLPALMAAVLSASAAAEVWQPFEALKRDGNTIETIKHRISVGQSALPDQLVIKASRTSLPLEARDGRPLGDEALIRLGRGPQLRAPMRLEAVVQGNRVAADVRRAASVANQSAAAIAYASQLRFGALQVNVRATYECDGAILFDVAYSGNAANVETLELVMELNGQVSFAYRGLPANFRPDKIDTNLLNVDLPVDTEATVWTSRNKWVPGADGPFVRYLTFGSLDRAFTWLADDPAGFVMGDDTPMMVIERDQLGRATLRVRLIGRAGNLDGEKTAKFALIVHPSKPRPAGIRNTQWLDWPEAAKNNAIDGIANSTIAARQRLREAALVGNSTVLPGLTAGAFGSLAAAIELSGFAGADMISPVSDNVRLYPDSLMGVLAGPYRNQPTRIHSNVREIISGGVNVNYDRQILGRALVNDIGVAIAGMHQPVELLRLAKALKEFGFFDDDETEVLPHWRNTGYVRYGEEWSDDDQFALTDDNPAEGVFVTVFRRSLELEGQKGYQALFVIMNARDNAVRERFYILDPLRIFGGINTVTSTSIALDRSFASILELSDWRPSIIKTITGSHGSRPSLSNPRALRDLEDNSVVEHTPVARYQPPPEIYGLVYIFPRDFRILYGYWLPAN